jgi:hypothetical protein
MSNELQQLISQSLRTLLSETMFHAEAHGGYLLNAGEPGFIDTMKSLSAARASKSPGPGRKPIVSHANHVLYGWDLLNRVLHGEDKVFETANWSTAWELESVTDAEWQALVAKLERTGNEVLELGPKFEHWNEIMLTGMYGSAAHTAYHLGAIRQILRELGG